VCAILDDHKVKCWGLNAEAELGYGDTTPRGRTPGEMGDALPTVDLGTGRTAQQISVGHYGTCALLDEGSVKCWGALEGLATAATGRTGDALPPLPLPAGRRAASVTTGHNFPIVILDDGTGAVWSNGQATIPDFQTSSRIVQATRGHDQTVVLFEDGSDTLLGQPLDAPAAPSLPFGVAALSLTGDDEELCARLVDGHVRCEAWGPFALTAADTQALAIGVNAPKCALMIDGTVRCQADSALGCNFDDTGLSYWCDVEGNDGLVHVRLPQPAVSIGAGIWSTCALLTDGSVWCWGSLADGSGALAPNAPFQASQGELESFRPWLGGTVSVAIGADGRRVYAGWRAVDLGTHR
jgi:hypothetical protein